MRQMFGSDIVPALFGGPWTWLYAGDGPPVASPSDVPRWLAWIAFLGVVLLTILLRPAATRAWVLLLLYAAPVAALLAATRLGGIYSVAAGMAARYSSDVIVVGALCIGVAVFGLVDRSAAEPIGRWTLPAQFARPSPSVAGALIAVCIVGLGIIAAWRVSKRGRVR